MSVIFKSKDSVMRLISLINEYTGIIKENLTDAVAELIKKGKRYNTIIGGICSATVEEVRAEDFGNITTVIDYLFRNNPNLRYVELPESVTYIGTNCFRDCPNLDMPFLPDGIEMLYLNTFNNCANLTLSKLPDNLTCVDEGAFQNCSKLRISEIPAGVTEIRKSSFSGCSSIESLTFKGIPSYINRAAFTNCSNLRVINVPWAEGAVGNAPWGALNATINYNYSE